MAVVKLIDTASGETRLMKNVVGILLVVAIGWLGITFARQAFTNGVQTVIASEPAETKVDSAPVSTWDSDCVLGPANDRIVNQNHCHAEAIWRKQDAAAPDAKRDAPLDVGMTESDSQHAVFWFGASVIALLLVLGGVGAGVMWMVRE